VISTDSFIRSDLESGGAITGIKSQKVGTFASVHDQHSLSRRFSPYEAFLNPAFSPSAVVFENIKIETKLWVAAAA
jgi:hypothetical protein